MQQRSMEIRVRGANCTVPDGVRQEAVEKLSRVRKVFDRFIEMEIVFTEDRNPRITDRHHCEVVLHAKGRSLRAEGVGPDHSAAIASAEDRLGRQVRKYKTKVVSKGRRDTAAARADLEQQVSAGPL